MALKEYPKIRKLFLTGDQAASERELQERECNDQRIEVIHTTQVIAMSEHPVDAIRRKKDSSVSRAIDLVKRGEADAIVSAGHTGAMVANATIKLRALEGVERPGLPLTFPPNAMFSFSLTLEPMSTLDRSTWCSMQLWAPSSPKCARLRESGCRTHVHRWRRRQGERIYQGHLQIAQKDQTELPRERRRPRSL